MSKEPAPVDELQASALKEYGAHRVTRSNEDIPLFHHSDEIVRKRFDANKRLRECEKTFRRREDDGGEGTNPTGRRNALLVGAGVIVVAAVAVTGIVLSRAGSPSPGTPNAPASSISVTSTAVHTIWPPSGPCNPFKVSFVWTTTGAQPGETAEASFGGPGIPPIGSAKVESDGYVAFIFSVNGPGDWTAQLTKGGGRAVPKGQGAIDSGQIDSKTAKVDTNCTR